MTTEDFITMLFCQIDDPMKDVPRHPLAQLYPSEVVTVGVLFALKGGGERAFDRWLRKDYLSLFPHLPERTRLFRVLTQLRDWTQRFLADPGLPCVADTYGIELLHPRREGRSPQQLGSKGTSNLRWIVGAKFAFVLDPLGRFVAWDCNWARVADSAFRPLIAALDGQTIVLVDRAFHGHTGDPANMKVSARGTWNTRRLIETVLSMLTTICHLKKIAHRAADYIRMRMAYITAAFNVLVQWHGFQPDDQGFVKLSIAEFSL